MAKVEIEFTLKNGDKVVTSNQAIIDQLKATGAAYTEVGTTAEQTAEKQIGANEEVATSYQDILKEYKANVKELNALAIAGDTTSERFQELQGKVASAKDALDDNSRALKANKSFGDALVGSISGVAGGFAAAQGLIGTFASESEGLQKALLKVQSALAFAQGIEQLKDAKDSFSALGASVKGPVVSAFNGLKGAIGATGIGLLVIGISLLIINFDKVKQAVLNFIPGLAKVGEFIGNLVNGITDFIGLTSEAERAATKLNAASEKNLKTSQDELEVLKARGATADVIYKKEREQSQQRINDLNEIQKLNKTLTEDELKERTELIQKIKVLDAAETKRKEDDAKKASDEAAKRAKEEADKAQEISKKRQAGAVTDSRRRLELIDNELQKKLSTLDLEYREERKKAKENFESLQVIEQVYQKNRQDILKQFGESYKKETSQIYLDLANITQGDYELEENLLIESNKKRLQELKSFQDQQIAALKAAGKDISFEEEQQRKDTQALTKLGDELILKSRRTALINGYKTLLEAEKSLNKDRLEDIKKTNGISEDLARINLAVFRLENAERVRLEETAIKSATESDAKAILEKIQNKDVEVSKLTEKQKALYDTYQALIKANEGDEFKTNIAIAAFNKEFTDNEVKRVLKFYKDLTDERQKNYENEIALNDKLAELDSKSSDDRLSVDNAYYTELIKAQNEFGTDYQKFTNYKTLLDKKAAQDQLKIQIKLIEDKVALIKADPTSDPEKVKALEAELLKLRSQSAAAEIDIEKQKAAEKLALQQKVTEEINALLAESSALISDLFALEIQKQTKHYDDLLQANEDYYNKLSEQNTEALNAEINDYSLTAEEKTNIQEEYALREYEIRKKQAEEDKRLEAEKNEELKQLKKKQARIDFTIQIAQIIGNTALAISSAIAASPLTFGLPWSAVNAVTGGIQVAAAIAQLAQVESLEQGGLLKGKSHAQGGIPIGNTGIEVEGGEAVINKRSTAMYAPLLSAINMAGGGRPITPNFTSSMALGGQMIFDQNSITQAIQDGMQSGQINRAYILSSDVQSDIVKNNRIRRQASF